MILKILLLLCGIGIGLFIAARMRRQQYDARPDLRSPPRQTTTRPAPRIIENTPPTPTALDDPETAERLSALLNDPGLLTLVRQHRKIEAVKFLHDRTNLSLRDAKKAVDALFDQQG